jgi:starvation-inducible outer membrane lipoprotein
MRRLTTWIGMGGLLLAGCATVHPDFQKYFNA